MTPDIARLQATYGKGMVYRMKPNAHNYDIIEHMAKQKMDRKSHRVENDLSGLEQHGSKTTANNSGMLSRGEINVEMRGDEGRLSA